MRLTLLLLLAAGLSWALELGEELPDPTSWTLDGEALRVLHANSLEELLRESPFLRVESFGGAALPFRASAGPWSMDEILIVVDGYPARDPWTGENQVPHIPLALIDRLDFSRRPSALEFGSAGASGVLRVTTRRHAGRSARANFHVCPLMIGEPWTTRFSVETPPGGLALAVALDSYDRSLSTFSERTGEDGTYPEVSSSQWRSLVTRLDLHGGAAGPMSFQLLQSDASFALSGGPSDDHVRQLYRFTLAAPETPLGEFLFAQSSIDGNSEMSQSGALGLELRWAKRKGFMGVRGLAAFAGGRWWDPSWEENGEVSLLDEIGNAYAALNWSLPATLGFQPSAGARFEKEAGSESGYQYQVNLSRPFRSRPMRVEVFAAGGRQREAWAYDRFDSEVLWPGAVIAPGNGSARDFLRGGLSLGAYTQSWSWSMGVLGHGSSEVWMLDTDNATWIQSSYNSGGSVSFTGRARLRRPARWLDWSLDTFFALLGGSRTRPPGSLEGSLTLESAFGEDASTGLTYPNRARVGFDYLRSIAEGDGHWRIYSPLEIRWGESAETLVTWDLTVELRVLDGRIWWRMRDMLHRGGEEIVGYPMPGREIQLGVDWVLFN